MPPIMTLNSEKLILPSPFLSTVWIISSISLYVIFPGRCINTNFISSAGMQPDTEHWNLNNVHSLKFCPIFALANMLTVLLLKLKFGETNATIVHSI